MVVHLSENTAFSKQACKVSPRTACEAAARVLLFKVSFATESAILASSKEGNQHPSFAGIQKSARYPAQLLAL